jgi:adenylate cyclase
MSAQIRIEVDQEPSKQVSLGQIFTIGRGPGNDLVVNDTRASRNHAVVRLQDKAYYLLDLGSSNGTLLNGRRVMIPSALKSGDEIIIANHRILFEQDAESQVGDNLSEDDMRTQVELTSTTVTILVVDIRNYTALTEAIPDVDLSRTIGKWFQEAQIVIESNEGTIHKFIGDAIMACWQKKDKSSTDTKYVTGPIKAAIELIHLAKLFDQELSATFPGRNFFIGCGINTGKAISGKVGSADLIGDCVNVAFRLESLCKELDRTIIVSEEVKKATEKDFEYEDLGRQKVKGKSQDLRVFSVKF